MDWEQRKMSEDGLGTDGKSENGSGKERERERSGDRLGNER